MDGSTHRLVLVPPHDPELEITILAEILEPLKRTSVLARVRADDFYDPRNRRVFEGRGLSSDDIAYRDHVIGGAWPLTAGALDRFLEYGDRRRRIAQLESERLKLYGVAL